MVEEECYHVENVGKIDENIPSTSFFHMLLATLVHVITSAPTHVRFSSILDVESVHLQAPTISNVVVEAQAMSWRPRNRLFICWGFLISTTICWWIW
jgi:hypothetical protein